MLSGNVVSIHVASSAGTQMESRQQVQAISGRDLEGDRYFDGKGRWSNDPGLSRQITLIETEAIEALARDNHIELAPAAARRNLVTRGVPLNHLVGREFQIGSVRLRGTKLCEPCKYLEELTVPGLMAGLSHRGGLRADIVSGGTICVGERITNGDTKMSHRGSPGIVAFEPESFSRDWVAAWNRLDVEAILAHYVDDVVFVSPLAATVTGDPEVHGKDKLRAYWTTAIRRRASPLRFTLESTVWNDDNRVLLIIFLSTEANGNLRKCELMHFGLNGLIYRGEAFAGATTP